MEEPKEPQPLPPAQAADNGDSLHSSSDEPPAKRARLEDSPATSGVGVEKKPREKIRGAALIKEE